MPNIHAFTYFFSKNMLQKLQRKKECKGEREGLTLKHMGIEKAVLKKYFIPNNPKSKSKKKKVK